MKDKKLTNTQKLNGTRKALKQVIGYPTKKQGRRDKDGYPTEFEYDEWSYKRMVESYRDALRNILKEFK